MIEHILHPRITDNKDWATFLFILSFAIIAITKSVYENRFSDFMNLLFYHFSFFLTGYFIGLFYSTIIDLIWLCIQDRFDTLHSNHNFSYFLYIVKIFGGKNYRYGIQYRRVCRAI